MAYASRSRIYRATRNHFRSLTSRSPIKDGRTKRGPAMVTWTASRHSLLADNRPSLRVSRGNKAKTATTIILIGFRCIDAGAAIAGRDMTCRAAGRTNNPRTTSSWPITGAVLGAAG